MIGICIVFLMTDEWGEFLAATAVRQLEATATGPFRIYGHALRADQTQMHFLSGLKVTFPKLPPAPAAPETISKEHSYLLDQLTSIAFADGCRAVATFDMDSWPILRGWDRQYAALVNEQVPVVAMVRTEFQDNFPFGAFTLLDKSFWKPGRSSFASNNPRSLSSRPSETGSGILDQLASEGQRFYRLERTNRWNPHPIIAGVYDDAVFHLGAGSRAPVFISDEAQYDLEGRPGRREFATAMNGAARETVLTALKSGHDAFITELIGGPPERIVPVLTDAASLPRQLPLTPRARRVAI